MTSDQRHKSSVDVSAPSGSHEQLELKELNDNIQVAINSLPDGCRAVFIKSRMEGKSHAEIAEEMNISKKTIENQMTKALKTLRAAVSKYRDYIVLLFAINML